MPPHEVKKAVRIGPVLRAYTRATLQYPLILSLSTIGVVAAQASMVVAPLYLRTFVNTLAHGAASPAIVHALLLTLVMFASFVMVGWIGRRIQSFFSQELEGRVMADLGNEAFACLMRQNYDFFISNFTGTLTRRVTRYSRAYEQVIDGILQNFLPTLLFAIGSIVVLFERSHVLGLALLAWVVVFVSIQVILTRWRHPLRVARVAEDSRLTGAVSDAVGNHSAVTFFAAEKYEEEHVGAIVASWRAITLRSWHADAVIQGAQEILALIVQVGLLVGAVYLWRRGLITVGDFVLIQVYVLGLIDRVWNIGNMLRRLYDGFADASEMLDIIELPHRVKDAQNARSLALTAGEIALDGVTFAFEDNRSVLPNFSLTIAGGEKVALVGPSGAGKSTITRLLLRLYDPNTGSICIDGQDLREITQESLRLAVSYVPQEPMLFHRTLAENIRYGRREASEEEVLAAAKSARCHDFISALPAGYATLVGERGVKLSGGERQRIAIARAILKNAPILILDEATSSLDSESEALIQEAFGKLMEGKTVIAIAHRLSTIMRMDRIIVMEGGRVILSGTHDELLSKGSNLYQKLWDIQAGGFIRGQD